MSESAECIDNDNTSREDGKGFSLREPEIEAEHLHCAGCFSIECEQAEPCPVIPCAYCTIRLHNCKLADHVENICSRAPAPCPNANYGCPIQLRRHLLAAHITHCPASIVHCPFIRNRQFINNKAKKLLKKIAKRQCPKFEPNVGDGEEMFIPDIAFARIDQAILEKFFATKREWRRKQQSSIWPKGLAEMSLTAEEIHSLSKEDSSDEEQRETERRHKIIREPFAGCRLCRINPGSQHLHELGSMRSTKKVPEEKEQNVKINKNAEEEDLLNFVPQFHRERGILLQPDVHFSGIVLDEHFLRTIFPIFACPSSFVRRDRFQAHYQSHLALEEASAFVGRCPNWQYGCPFKMETKKARDGGNLKFNPFLSACVHEPLPQLPAAQSLCLLPPFDELSLGLMSPNFFVLLAPYLDDASLLVLASSCRRFRELLPHILADRLTVELNWRREKGENNRHRFVQDGYRKYFAPIPGPPPPLIVQHLGPIIEHLRNGCRHNQVHNLGKERVDLRKYHGEVRESEMFIEDCNCAYND